MEKQLCSVFDSKAKVFSNPFVSTNNATALREFERAVNDRNTDLFNYPTDYSLYNLGVFDDNSGLITSHPEPQLLGLAVQYKTEV